jgi:hypothetical protein
MYAIPTKEERYQIMVEKIAQAISQNSRVESDLVHKIGALLEESRPNKSKRFAQMRFLKSCGLV